MMHRESIQISVEGTIKGFKGMYSEIKRITDGLRGWQKQVVGATDMAKKLNAPVEDLKRSMRAQGYLFRKSALETGNAARITAAFGGVLKGIGTIFGKVAKAGYSFIKSLKGFQPAWLSVMFLSMGIKKALSGMIKPVLELLGVFDIWRAMLVSALLPALMPLYDIFLNLMDWFFDMPEETQKLIGQFILFAAVVASIALAGSQLMLLLSSLGVSLGLMGVLVAPMVGIFALATGAVFKFGEEADTLTDKIVNFINTGVSAALIWIDAFVKKFMDNLPLIKSIAHKIVSALLEGIVEILDAIGPVVKTFLDTMFEMYVANKNKIYKIAKWIIDKLIQFSILFFPEVVDMGIMILDKIIEGIKENAERLAPAWNRLLNYLLNLVTTSAPMLLKAGLVIGKALLKGVWQFIKDNWVKIVFVGLMGLVGAIAGGAIGAIAGPAGIIAGAKIGGGIGAAMGLGTLGSFQTGGIVPETGPYTLHKGETVTPAGGMTFNTTVHANVSSDYDVKRLAAELSKEMSVNFERELKMRGSI